MELRVASTALCSPGVLDDDDAVRSGPIRLLLEGARAELEKASEGRPYHVTEMRITIGEGRDWEQIPDVVRAIIHVTAETEEAP